ncbi:MAG: hypothetical protein KGD74_00725 [Candidatus Lokiarchaeota archaeon]|nr:hypothetical protein [Candidatus Lokiarchaeota archaeon]
MSRSVGLSKGSNPCLTASSSDEHAAFKSHWMIDLASRCRRLLPNFMNFLSS